jgi:hypothetical protein
LTLAVTTLSSISVPTVVVGGGVTDASWGLLQPAARTDSAPANTALEINQQRRFFI